MNSTSRGPARRTRGTGAGAVPLFVRVDPTVRDLVHHYAELTNRNPWEVVTLAIQLLKTTEGPDGAPAGLETQPLLEGIPEEVSSAA